MSLYILTIKDSYWQFGINKVHALILLCRLNSDGTIKVGDFGLAEDVYSCGYFRQDGKENVRLPYKWMALESLNDCIFSEKTDVVI